MSNAGVTETSLRPIRFGTGTRVITPAPGAPLVGYPFVDRPAAAIHDDLFATALVLGEPGERVALVSVDLIAIGAKTTRELRQRIWERCRIQPDRVMIFATHTHSGPAMPINELIDEGVVGSADPAYVEHVIRSVVDAVEEAANSIVVGSIGFARERLDPPLGGNRRNPGGITDQTLSVLGILDQEGTAAAALISVNCHPTVLHADNLAVTSDLAWGVRENLASRPGRQVSLLYATGAAGDQSTRSTRRAQTFDEALRLGKLVADATDRALSRIAELQPTDMPVRPTALLQTVSLPLRQLPTPEEAEAELVLAQSRFDQLKADGADGPTLRTAEVDLFGARHTVRYATWWATSDRSTHWSAEVQAICLGDIRVLGLPVELFAASGLAIRDASADHQVVLAAYANDLMGYVPTRADYDNGGYETTVTLLGEGAAETLTEAAIELIRACPAEYYER